MTIHGANSGSSLIEFDIASGGKPIAEFDAPVRHDGGYGGYLPRQVVEVVPEPGSDLDAVAQVAELDGHKTKILETIDPLSGSIQMIALFRRHPEKPIAEVALVLEDEIPGQELRRALGVSIAKQGLTSAYLDPAVTNIPESEIADLAPKSKDGTYLFTPTEKGAGVVRYPRSRAA